MKGPPSAKIYLKIKGHLCDFMWANIGPDGTVIMGFRGTGAEKLSFVLDKNLGQLHPANIHIGTSTSPPKVSFHKSGHYKLSSCIGLKLKSIDRCTVIGTPLAEIEEPRRMMEIIIPKKLNSTKAQVTSRDIVLDSSQFSDRPLRCTISCLSHNRFHEIMESKAQWVNTSEYEVTGALDSGKHVWAWTLRVSREAFTAPDHFHYFLFGEMRWGKEHPDSFPDKD